MAVPPNPLPGLGEVFEDSVNQQIDVLKSYVRDTWDSKVADAKHYDQMIQEHEKRLESLRSALESIILSPGQTESEALGLLVKMYGRKRVLARWEAEGDLAPPGSREMLQHLHSLQPLPNPGPSAVRPTSTSPEQSSNRSVQSAEEEEENTTESGCSTQPVSQSNKRSAADSKEGSLEAGLVKRPRRSRGERSFTPATKPQPGRSLQPYEVDRVHWAFEYPQIGPGFFVLLCNPDIDLAHPFDDNPLTQIRGIRHLAGLSLTCHKDVDGLPAKFTEKDMVEKCGYQVEGMTQQMAKDSNQAIKDKRGTRVSHKSAPWKPRSAEEDDRAYNYSGKPPTTYANQHEKPKIRVINRSGAGPALEEDDFPHVSGLTNGADSTPGEGSLQLIISDLEQTFYGDDS